MVNSPLIRPAISWGFYGGIGGVHLDCHEICSKIVTGFKKKTETLVGEYTSRAWF